MLLILILTTTQLLSTLQRNLCTLLGIVGVALLGIGLIVGLKGIRRLKMEVQGLLMVQIPLDIF